MRKHMVLTSCGKAISLPNLLLFLFLSCLAACSNSEKIANVEIRKTSLIKPPLAGIEPAFLNFEIDASKGDSIRLASGTVINVPPNAFADAEGNIIKGKVGLRYREFNSAAGIFLSGIPMDYNAAGKKENLQSAGMFEIRAGFEGRELYLAGDKNISVKMASFTAENSYDKYFLDEQKGWQYTGRSEAIPNPERTRLQNEIAWLKSDRQFVFNFEGLMDVSSPEIMDKPNMVMALARKYNLDWKKFTCYSDVMYHDMPYPAGLMVWKKLTPQPVPSWTKGLEAILTLVKGNIYTMEINDYPKKLKYIAKIEAKLPLQQLYAFSPEAWEKNNAMVLSKIKEAEERLASEATVFRTLKVQQFGVFNCDRFVNDPRKVQLSASFNFDTEINDKLNNVHVYFMSDELKTVIMLPQLKNSLINMVPCKDARLFAVLPGNRLAVFSPTDFAKINFDELRKTTDPSYTFPLKSSAQVITSEADIKKVLQM